MISSLQRISEITEKDIFNGGTVDDLIRSAMEELGEFATAHSIETGYKKRELTEPAESEAVDLAICAIALYFAKGGQLDKFEEIANKKLDKWESKI